MEYTFAPVLTLDKLDYLQTLIQDFLVEFVRLYPDRPLTPKLHYLSHVVTWMKRLVTIDILLSMLYCRYHGHGVALLCSY